MTGVWPQLAKTAILFALGVCGCQSTAQVAQNPQAPKTNTEPQKEDKPQAPASPSPETRGPMMGGWHHHSAYGQLFFQGKYVTVEGEIARASAQSPLPQMTAGIQIVLKTAAGEKTIHLGPAWYIVQQEFSLAPGEKLKVEGRNVTVAGQPVIMASSVQKGSEKLTLRDENGYPLWAGTRMMHPK